MLVIYKSYTKMHGQQNIKKMSDTLELNLQTKDSIREVQRKLNKGRCHSISVWNLLFSCVLFKSLKIKFQRH